MTIQSLPVFNVNWISTRWPGTCIHTGQAPAPPSSRFPPRGPQVLGGNEWKLAYATVVWRQGAASSGGEPADWVSHLGSREPETGPSISVPCPLGPKPARQPGRAGTEWRSSLACQAGTCFDDSRFQWGQKCAHFTLCNAVGWSQPHRLTGHSCCIKVTNSPSYSHIEVYFFTVKYVRKCVQNKDISIYIYYIFHKDIHISLVLFCLLRHFFDISINHCN